MTPEQYLSLPTISTPVPNPDGTHVIFIKSWYDYDRHEASAQVCLETLDDKRQTIITSDNSTQEPLWLDGQTFAFLKSADIEGETVLVIGAIGISDLHEAGKLPAKVGDLKLANVGRSSRNRVGFVVTGLATPEGSLVDAAAVAKQKAEQPYCSGRVFDSLPVRNWNEYKTQNRQSLWYGSLTGDGDALSGWHIDQLPLQNLLIGLRLEAGGRESFDVAEHGVVFVARSTGRESTVSPASEVRFVPVGAGGHGGAKALKTLEVKNLQGAASCPRWSPSGREVAFLKMKDRMYEADRKEICIARFVGNNHFETHIVEVKDGNGDFWDRSPLDLSWSVDGKSLFLMVPEKGKIVLASLGLDQSISSGVARTVWMNGSIGGLQPFEIHGAIQKAIVNYSSFCDKMRWAVGGIDGDNSFGIEEDAVAEGQISGIWYEGAEHQVHAWVVKPVNFDKNKTYPLALMIHGGPQWAWFNSSDGMVSMPSPAIVAGQGYIAFCPNITGSIGYGQRFCDRLLNNWGGTPYEDLVKAMEYIRRHMDFVDLDRAVAIGVSWGGYMINWMQGRGLGRNFKALVCDSGFFSTLKETSTDEPWVGINDFGGPYPEQSKEWLRWSPSEMADQWQTPELVIHNELDYRVPIAEGFATFNTLQLRRVSSRMIVFPDEGHLVWQPENRLQYYSEIIKWVNKYVGLHSYAGQARYNIQSSSQI